MAGFRGARARSVVSLACIPLLLAACNFVEAASVSTSGALGDAPSTAPDLDGSGRYVAFVSASTTLGNNPSGQLQVWRRDLKTRSTVLVSGAVGCAGAACVGGNGPSEFPTISRDGRYVAFSSKATNLAPVGQATANEQVYRADLINGTLQMVSVTGTGTPGDGQSTLFRSNSTPFGNAAVGQAMSGDGDRVAFLSAAPNLGGAGIYGLRLSVRTLSTGTTVPLGPTFNVRGWDVSDDGGTVVVTSESIEESPPDFLATTRVDAFATDGTGQTTVFSAFANSNFPGKYIRNAAVDGDGSRVLVTSTESDVGVPPPATYRLYELASGSATLSSFAQTTPDGIALDLDPAGETAVIRVATGSFLCSVDALAACLSAAPTFPALTAGRVPLTHGFPVMSNDGRMFAFVTASGQASSADTNGLADVYVSTRPVKVASVTAASPLTSGGSAVLTVLGDGFAAGETSVSIGGTSHQSFGVTSIDVVSRGELRVGVTAAPGLAPAGYDLTIAVANAAVAGRAVTSITCGGCVVVSPSGS